MSVRLYVWLEITRLSKKTSPKIEKHKSAKAYYILIIKTFSKAYDLLLLFLQKICFLGVVHTDPFFALVTPKSLQFLEVLPIFFFRSTGLYLKLVILVEYPNNEIIGTQQIKTK